MRTETLLDELRRQDVRLDIGRTAGSLRVDAPAGVVTEGLRALLLDRKTELMKLIRKEQERRRREEADRRGLVIRFAEQPGWISLHDPTDGSWHEVRAEECLPGIVEAAERAARRKQNPRAG
jgi:hypothetical protein